MALQDMHGGNYYIVMVPKTPDGHLMYDEALDAIKVVPSAQEVHLGEIGGKTIIVSVSPTVTAGAYHANDACGGLMTFANAVRVSGGTGLLQGITVFDAAKQAAEIIITFFDRTFTATADNDAFDPTDADLANCIGQVKIATSDYASYNDNAMACKSNIGLPFKLNGTSLFAQAMVTGTPTYAATTDLKITVRILAD